MKSVKNLREYLDVLLIKEGQGGLSPLLFIGLMKMAGTLNCVTSSGQNHPLSVTDYSSKYFVADDETARNTRNEYSAAWKLNRE